MMNTLRRLLVIAVTAAAGTVGIVQRADAGLRLSAPRTGGHVSESVDLERTSCCS